MPEELKDLKGDSSVDVSDIVQLCVCGHVLCVWGFTTTDSQESNLVLRISCLILTFNVSVQ